MYRILMFALAGTLVAACGDETQSADAGLDASTRDAGDGGAAADAAAPDAASDAAATDASASDAAATDAATDAATSDAATADGGAGMCDPMDAAMGRECGPTERPANRWRWDGFTCERVAWCECLGADCDALFNTEDACTRAYTSCDTCATDADCPAGAEWCEAGRCVECDNSGLACRISCPAGWNVYQRNGCSPCACAPENECGDGLACRGGERCYAGAFCWDWCPPGDPSCCFGNLCEPAGCAEPHPVGCRQRGCALDKTCDLDAGCESSSCGCSDGLWVCTRDCGGGTCVPR